MTSIKSQAPKSKQIPMIKIQNFQTKLSPFGVFFLPWAGKGGNVYVLIETHLPKNIPSPGGRG
jgi:hypothetical protein